jgi:predicted DNA-binding transcriptional regulator AlpA
MRKQSYPPTSDTNRDLEPWLTIADFLSWSRISRTTFYTLLRANEGPEISRFAARTIRISREAALEWARSRYYRRGL